MSKSERILLWSTAALSLLLRAIALFRYRFDSDEQQHAHVAWGWVAGGIQYRDFFDNHHPLFHILTAPIVAIIDERPTILLWLRIPMLALFAVAIWGTYEIGRRLYGERAGLWSAVLLSLFPPFFLKSLEFRNDNLWTAFCVIAFVLLTREEMTKKQAFIVGLLLGAAFAVSVKTVVVVIALIAALVRRPKRPPLHWGILGFAVVPVLLVIFFAASGAWDALVYCVWTFNANVASFRKYLWIGRVIFPFAFAITMYIAWRLRASFFPIMLAVYIVTLCCLWPLISPRDFLPVMPLAAIFLAASIERARTFAVIAIVFVVSLFYYADRFANKTAWHTTMMEQALRLSHPGEMILDVKGETIFRPRPTYPIFEIVTRTQIAKGLIRDTVAEDVIRTRTHVAQADGPMWPARARKFLSENFLDMGRLRASGQWIENGSFTIAVPGEYMIVSERGTVSPAREYAAGTYRFAAKNEKLAVMWAPAFRRGHSPFHLRDRRF